MIVALLLASVVAGQFAAEPPAKLANPLPPAIMRAPRKVQEPPAAPAPRQKVLSGRQKRQVAINRRRAINEAREQAAYEREMVAQAKAIKEYQDYVVKMGPIWAAENANQIQAQRNALIAQQTELQARIASQEARDRAWLLWQLQTQRR